MKPLKLEFKGINSFTERTIIDFDVLTKNGIFGIFGDTGSGKSTILDCINFALYGSVERSKEKTDIINYRAAAAEVKFIFNILNDGRRKTYTVERTLKKDKYGTHKAALYENDGSGEVCIADKASQVERKIVDILGVEAEDFRKCIALPQGEFAQFVKSSPSARLALIERLFSLFRYGDRLKEKINYRQSQTEGIYQNLSGRLLSYEDITKERLDCVSLQLKNGRAQLEELKTKEKAATEKAEKLKALNALFKELETINKSLEAAYAKKPEIDGLRADLSVLAQCKEAVDLSDETDKKRREVSAAKLRLSDLENKIGANICLVERYNGQLKSGNFDELISQRVALAATYSVCDGKEEKLKNALASLTACRENYRRIDEEKNAISVRLEEAKAEVEKCRQSLELCSLENVENLINVQFKGAVLKEEYIKNLDYFANLKGNIRVYEEQSPLYEYVSGEVTAKIEEYKQRVNDVRDFKISGIEAQVERFNLLEKQRVEAQKALNSANEAAQSLAAKLQIKENQLESAKKEGKELRLRADEIKSELERAFGKDCTDYAAAVKQNADEIKKLRTEKEECEKGLRAAESAVNELKVSIESVKALIGAAEKDINALEEKTAAIINSIPHKSVEKCRELSSKFSNVAEAHKAVSDFDLRLSSLELRRDELTKTEGITSVSDELLQSAEREKSSICGGVATLTGEIAVLENEKNSLEARLKEKLEILKEFEGVEKERTLIARLKEVTKSNKFLEFIANEYLTEISSLASSTLLKLNDGRYFLTYKDNNFFVGDNYDCGNLRGVNTLSGGETFLVSLSLALALSQTICARSLKSIEFFFLDEGFGTLDSTLVDTVMDALEKLKSSSFTIGVISHVEELKHRISNKITVNKATESRGSTVEASC